MQLKTTTPIPSSRFSINKKIKAATIHIRGSSQTPTLRKKFSPHLNKSFNCYEEPVFIPSQSRGSPSVLRDNLTIKKTKNRLRVSPRAQNLSKMSSVKLEMSNRNYRKALDMLNRLMQDEPGNDVRYYRGVCFMHLKLYADAICDLKSLQETSPSYDPQLYVALYMSYMYINDYQTALKCLTTCVHYFPKYSKGYLLRGQMLNKLKKYEKAIKDFKKINENDSALYLAQSYKGLRQYQKALGYLEKAENNENIKESALIEKSKVLYKLGMLEESKVILENFINKNNFLVNYYLSKIKIQENDLVQALLLLEQVSQYSQDSVISLRAICKIALIMLKEKDYYGALHTFQRANGKLNTKNKKNLYQYTEAIVSLMKKKLSEGIDIFTSLIEDGSLKNYIVNCYIFRAYGHYASGKYELCINDYNEASYSQVLDKASEFNFSISKGIVSSKSTSQKIALKTFKLLTSHFPKNPIAEICQVCVLLNSSISDPDVLQKAAKIMTKASNKRTDSEVLYIKSLISYFQSNFDQAFAYIKECIDKAEENIYNHYVVRGFCNLALKVYQDAVQDFTISLQLNEGLTELFTYRGLCGYLSDDYALALDDFLTYSKSEGQPSLMMSARLLLFTASYSDALSLLSNTAETEEVLLLKGYSYLMTENNEKCLSTLKKVKSPTSQIDISYIQKITKGEVEYFGTGYLFTKKYALWIKGLQLMYQGNYIQSIDVFQDVLEIMHSTESELFNDNIIIEEENCEVLYNIALCNCLNENTNNKEHSLLILKELAEVVNIEHRGQLFLICAILELSQNSKENAEKFLQESAKCSPEHCQKFLDGEAVEILPLHTANDFSSRFPLLHYYANEKIYLRPAVTLPKFLPPLNFSDSCKILKSLFNFDTILPRPEAPWLNRSKGSIQFTESIIEIDLEDSKKNSKVNVVKGKEWRSQQIRQKHSSFVKAEIQRENSRINDLMNKIKVICS